MKGRLKLHEVGIALQIIRIARGAIPGDTGDAQVEKVYLNIGKLSAVVPDSLRFCFGVAARGTPLSDAELVINEIPARAKCRACHHEWAIDDFVFGCPACDSGGIEVVSGREIDVESIEIRD